VILKQAPATSSLHRFKIETIFYLVGQKCCIYSNVKEEMQEGTITQTKKEMHSAANMLYLRLDKTRHKMQMGEKK
jgi:hypothetical protein